ncbi:MAG: hypothetical protein N2Z20_01385 [Elusimicrobiales bacterium]|nr:hypothetical protein [Elusimicrobiales bacterium]
MKKYTNSTWIDNKSYITVVTPDKMSKPTILYHFAKELTLQEMNDYTTIFNTISYIVSAGLKETSRNKEILLIEKLKKRKGIL